MYQRITDLYYENIVIGSNINALSYAYFHNTYLLFARLQKPFLYDIEDGWKYKIKLWNKLAFNLSFRGMIPFGEKIQNIRLDNNIVKVFTKDNFIYNITYKNVVVCDDYKLDGFSEKNNEQNYKCIIQDHFNVLSGVNHDLEYINCNDDELKIIWFYDSLRHKNQIKAKDCVSVSLVDIKDMNNDNNSIGIIKMKTIKAMKKAGIKGRKNGINNPTRPLDIKHATREIIYLNNIHINNWDWKKQNYNDLRTFK